MTPEAIKAIETVKKLLALAANSAATEAEAASATEKAMALLAAHNIELAQLNTAEKTRADNRYKGGLYPWQRNIWNAVADMNFCVYWTLKGSDKGSKFEHRLVGSHANVIATTLMCDYLCSVTDRLGKEWAKLYGHNIFAKATNSYKEGISERLQERLRSIKYKREAEARQKQKEYAEQHSTGNSVTIFSVANTEKAANDDYLYGEGYTARRLQREAESKALWEEARIAAEQWRRENPEAAAKAEKEIAEANAKYWANEEKKAARRKPRQITEPRYKGDAGARAAGYHKGADIGLDPQATHRDVKKLT